MTLRLYTLRLLRLLEDAVIKELPESREVHARSFNYDVKAIVADLKITGTPVGATPYQTSSGGEKP